MTTNPAVEIDLDKQRAEFEAAVRELDVNESDLARDGFGDYIDSQIAYNWSGWKMAARAQARASQAVAEPHLTNGMTDADLISYCESHCTTERALFNADQVNRMIYLAGHPDWCVREVSGWMSVHDNMAELCKLARNRLAAPVAQQSEAHTEPVPMTELAPPHVNKPSDAALAYIAQQSEVGAGIWPRVRKMIAESRFDFHRLEGQDESEIQAWVEDKLAEAGAPTAAALPNGWTVEQFENAEFHAWWESSGQKAAHDLRTENAAHATWQERAARWRHQAAPTSGRESAAPVAKQEALEQLITEHRIAITPENEGGFHAHVYRDSDVPQAKAYGPTPRAAVDAALAEACIYPKCNCPFDAPSDPSWCARGLQKGAQQ